MGFQIDALLVRIKVRQAGVENNDDARYQEMSLKLLEALEGGARSAGRQTLSFQEKPVTEGLKVDARCRARFHVYHVRLQVPNVKLLETLTSDRHLSAEDKPKFSCRLKVSTHIKIKSEKLSSS
ncbi:hypothetical protein EAE99_000904 [Botrytis elliptica]|nr:hypothetical protein EAE99_000904 [Botrytis elliptica]